MGKFAVFAFIVGHVVWWGWNILFPLGYQHERNFREWQKREQRKRDR